jgi:capsular polysaccharide biosynthesis protein
MHTADPFDTPANRISMYWATLRRRWRLAAAILAVAVVTGVAVGMLMPSSYQATAKVLIGQRAQLDALLGAADYAPDPEREVNTNLALISLEPVADDVRRRLGLRAGSGELLGKLSAEIDRNSNVVSITVRDASPREAARIANAFALAFRDFAARSSRASLDEAVTAARERAAQLPVGRDRDALEAEIRRMEAAGAFTTGGVQVVRRATAASASATGSVAATGLIAGFLGVLLAAVTMVVLARTDRSVRDEEEIEAVLELPVLATVPPVPGPSTDIAARDAFAGLALTLGVGGAPPRNGSSNGSGGYVLLVTSPGPGDGTTAVTLGLARALGELGRRTLAIEADLRSPRFAPELDLGPTAGLAGILAEGRSLDDELLELPLGIGPGMPGGDLALGTSAPLPQPLLAGARMAGVLAEARRRANVVLVAGAATDEFPDSLALAAQADAVLLVARIGATRRDALQRAQRAFEQLGVHVAGVVATAARPARRAGVPARLRPPAHAAPANGSAHETPEVIAQ